MSAFRVRALLAIFRGVFQTGIQIGLRDVLDIPPLPECGGPEPLTIVLRKCFLVGVEPCFHRLDHEVDLIVRSSLGALPAIAGAQPAMLPRVSLGHWVFAIYQQDGTSFLPAFA